MTTNAQNPLTTIGIRTATLDEIREIAPAAFSTQPHPDRSERYSFVSTAELLYAFEKLGWTPYASKQNGKSPYARHLIRLNNPELGFMDLKSDKVKPQIIIDNSHDGSSPAMTHMGLFRLVCSNGLVIAMPGMFSSIKLRHVGIDFEELKQLTNVIAEQYKTVGLHIGDMQQHIMNQDQKEEFAIKAVAYREPHVFINPDGTINVQKVSSMTNPLQLIEPLRGEDRADNLWSVFNVVQERLVKGEFERKSASGRKTKPRSLTHATRNLNFNQALWAEAEKYMALA